MHSVFNSVSPSIPTLSVEVFLPWEPCYEQGIKAIPSSNLRGLPAFTHSNIQYIVISTLIRKNKIRHQSTKKVMIKLSFSLSLIITKYRKLLCCFHNSHFLQSERGAVQLWMYQQHGHIHSILSRHEGYFLVRVCFFSTSKPADWKNNPRIADLLHLVCVVTTLPWLWLEIEEAGIESSDLIPLWWIHFRKYGVLNYAINHEHGD